MAPISQREARRLQKRVQHLETILINQRRSWDNDYFAVEIGRVEWQPFDPIPVAARTARKLGHAVVVIANDVGLVRFFALPHPSEPV